MLFPDVMSSSMQSKVSGIPYRDLLRLLSSGRARDVAANIGDLVTLTHNTLDGLPALANLGRSALVGDSGIGTGSKLADSLLDEGALRIAGAEERQVDYQEDPATLGESDSGQSKSEQQGDLEGCDNTHASIVVLLDEPSNGLGEGRLLDSGLGGRRGGRGRGGRSSGLQGRD